MNFSARVEQVFGELVAQFQPSDELAALSLRVQAQAMVLDEVIAPFPDVPGGPVISGATSARAVSSGVVQATSEALAVSDAASDATNETGGRTK